DQPEKSRICEMEQDQPQDEDGESAVNPIASNTASETIRSAAPGQDPDPDRMDTDSNQLLHLDRTQTQTGCGQNLDRTWTARLLSAH
uniref:Uncharacterized protein n=1 Tax=Monopterus albus TaxID=43700 RepID=A0A3Q3JF05_MONAL